MTTISWIAYFLSWPLIIYIVLEQYLRKHLDKPPVVKIMRLLSMLALIAVLPLGLQLMLESWQLALGIAHNNINSRIGWLAFRIIGGLIVIYAFLFWFCGWRYCIRHDTKTIQHKWYMEKHFASLEAKKTEEAFQYLRKASELKQDSVYIWSMLAVYNANSDPNSSAIDDCLLKAKEALTASQQPLEDEALLESSIGAVLLFYRRKIEEGLAHFKTACDLDPANSKPKYERALQWAREQEATP